MVRLPRGLVAVVLLANAACAVDHPCGFCAEDVDLTQLEDPFVEAINRTYTGRFETADPAQEPCSFDGSGYTMEIHSIGQMVCRDMEDGENAPCSRAVSAWMDVAATLTIDDQVHLAFDGDAGMQNRGNGYDNPENLGDVQMFLYLREAGTPAVVGGVSSPMSPPPEAFVHPSDGFSRFLAVRHTCRMTVKEEMIDEVVPQPKNVPQPRH